MEVCTTLGMLSPEQARQLKEAGLTGAFVFPGLDIKCSSLCLRVQPTTII